jgi:hypothetical protein
LPLRQSPSLLLSFISWPLEINYATADFKLGHQVFGYVDTRNNWSEVINFNKGVCPIATAPRPARVQSHPSPFGDVGAGALSQRLFATERPIAF